jgi:hypothetical protein
MRACVCDKCGKVVLASDDDTLSLVPEGICRLSDGRRDGVCLDLCVECVGKLMKAVREQESEG